MSIDTYYISKEFKTFLTEIEQELDYEYDRRLQRLVEIKNRCSDFLKLKDNIAAEFHYDTLKQCRMALKHLLSAIPIKYSYGGIELKYLYNCNSGRKDKSEHRNNGSDPQTRQSLRNALKMQCFYYLDDIKTLCSNEDDVILYLTAIGLKLSLNINNLMTWENTSNPMNYDVVYNPIRIKDISEMAKTIIEQLANKNLYVYTMKLQRLKLSSGNEVPNFLTKELLIKEINDFGSKKPATMELLMSLKRRYNQLACMTDSNLRYYIKQYDLYHLLNIKKRKTSKEKSLETESGAMMMTAQEEFDNYYKASAGMGPIIKDFSLELIK